ncbi:FeoC-like transcriptional regulator [Streptomyces xanthochromogenes]|uniref:Transcriptional regulator HTH-type FeoC domain-containing protein n=1 Tax=Streptomyces xanthochromogenes TaxID=67384 RepID=A0ABQ2ZH63_9ACTN|nr:FeoC-like transcriptional regulator [Streptomyces xanthochromogenes]GGY16408.1 hypothetical protein GCM10010326_05500 [Streptomyces xanthochromogenes]
MSTLRQVLAAIESAARTGAGLDSVARSLGLSRAEVDAMAEYWVRKGRLTREEIGGGCPAAAAPSRAADVPLPAVGLHRSS